MSTWGRSDPDKRSVDQRVDQPTLERVGSPRNSAGIVVLILLVVAGLGLMLAKPWALGPGPRSSPPFAFVTPEPATPPPAPPTAQPRPTIDPLVLAVQRRQCQSPEEWRLVTAERSGDRDTRTMYAAAPKFAAGPTDPAIALSHLYATDLQAVGVCVPRAGRLNPLQTLLSIRLWQITGPAAASEVHGAVVTDKPLYTIGEAYWAPPGGGLWPAGRYVFEITSEVSGQDRWIGLEFTPTPFVISARAGP